MTNQEPFSIQGALQLGWEKTKEHFVFFVGFVILVFLASSIPDLPKYLHLEQTLPLMFGMLVVSLVINMAVGIWAAKVGLTTEAGNKPSLKEFSFTLNQFFHYVVGSILVGLAVLAGLILLIIPGIYLAIKYQFYGYLIIDKGMEPIDALKQSFKMTNGAELQLVLFGLAATVITFLGIVTFGLGMFVAFPVLLVAGAHIYRQLLKA